MPVRLRGGSRAYGPLPSELRALRICLENGDIFHQGCPGSRCDRVPAQEIVDLTTERRLVRREYVGLKVSIGSKAAPRPNSVKPLILHW